MGCSCETVQESCHSVNDTDTFALLLYYTPFFPALGMKEIWQQYGTVEKRRMLPLHQAVSQLGAPLAKTVIKAHILTGDDCMSKVVSLERQTPCQSKIQH